MMNETQKLHQDSIRLARIFREEYAVDKDSDATAEALKNYIEARRKMEKTESGKRFGSYEAYRTCQGIS